MPEMPYAYADAPGLFAQLRAWLSANLAYLKARLELAGIEGREAIGQYVIILALLIGALIGAIFGYLFLVISAVFLIARAFEDGDAWMWVMLGAALLHLLGAVVLVLIAKAKFGKPLFTATLDEFKKDQAWLKTPGNPN